MDLVKKTPLGWIASFDDPQRFLRKKDFMFAFTPTQLIQQLEKANCTVLDKRFDLTRYTFKLAEQLYITAKNNGEILVRGYGINDWNKDARQRLESFLPNHTRWRIKSIAGRSNAVQSEPIALESPEPSSLSIANENDCQAKLKEFMEFDPSVIESPKQTKPAKPRRPNKAAPDKPYDPSGEEW